MDKCGQRMCKKNYLVRRLSLVKSYTPRFNKKIV